MVVNRISLFFTPFQGLQFNAGSGELWKSFQVLCSPNRSSKELLEMYKKKKSQNMMLLDCFVAQSSKQAVQNMQNLINMRLVLEEP